MSTPNCPPADPVRRGLLPEVLTLEDVAIALALPSAAAARRLLLREGLCPYARVGSRVFVRRDALLRALAEREVEGPGARAISLVGGVEPPTGRPIERGGSQ